MVVISLGWQPHGSRRLRALGRGVHLGARRREFYLHYAGHQQSYDVEAIYDRHRDLFDPASVEALRELGVGDHGGEARHRRRLEILLDFAIEGLIGQTTKELEGELARREVASSIELDGERIGFRESSVVQANEPDGERRAELETARLALTERELGPLYEELVERQHAGAIELGYPSYRAMCAITKGIDLERLGRQTAVFEARTRASYPPLLDPELRRTVGFGLDELRRSDFARFFRAVEPDRLFPGVRLTDSFAETMSGLGIDISAQPGVTFDVESRPDKAPRAFCAPVRVPGEVYLVIAPVGGWDDYVTLFHEGGHTEHFAHVDAGLPVEYRFMGDNAVTECFAFVFQHLVEDPSGCRATSASMTPRAGRARAGRAADVSPSVHRQARLRTRAARRGLGLDGDALAARYSQLLGGAVLIDWPAETFLSDVDPGFYCACYLRAWALEAHLRRYLHERFGPEWFTSPRRARSCGGCGVKASDSRRRDARRADRRRTRLRRGPHRPRAERVAPAGAGGSAVRTTKPRLYDPASPIADRTATGSTSSCHRIRDAAPPPSCISASRMCSVPTCSAPSADASRPARSIAAVAAPVDGRSSPGSSTPRPSIRTTAARTGSYTTPSDASTPAATPSCPRRSPSRMCSVPM